MLFKPSSKDLLVRFSLRISMFAGLLSAVLTLAIGVTAQGPQGNSDPQLPPFANIDKETYLALRSEQVALLRGWEPGKPFTSAPRTRALNLMEQQIRNAPRSPKFNGAAWTAIGPAPIPNGQTETTVNSVSGRLTSMVVDPTNSNTLYVGAAQGGVWRSLNGGTTFVPIFDTASSLAIGALTLDPADNTRLWVGTGESNGSGDSFAGVGLYRVDSANTVPVLNGPINPARTYLDGSSVSQTVPVFNGRSISKILVNPLDSNVLFVSTAGGVIGMSGDSPFGGFVPPLGLRGLYRLSAATGPIGAIGVERIKVSTSAGGFDTPNTGNRNVNDMVFDSADATFNTLIAWQNGTSAAGDGGVWRSANALASPGSSVVFSQTLLTTSTSTSNGRGALAIYKPAAAPSVVYVASGETTTGAIRRSIDGGVTWSAKFVPGAGFCGGQCFYNIGLAVVGGATTATDRIHLGGNVTGASTRLHGRSLDGGATFVNLATGLHADTHFIYVDPTTNTTVYHLNDGGIWKSTDSGATWTSLNGNGLNVAQFESVAVHPTDPNFTIGGTQDNGTECLGPCNQAPTTWIRADYGDGGFAAIDQNATDTTTVTMYHTYFNQTNAMGYSRVLTTAAAFDGNWSFYGCGFGGSIANGMTCAATAILFYAPMALGPGSPNTLYFGSDVLYRSTNSGVTMVKVSQEPVVSGKPISAIGISPQDDNYRIVGLTSGGLFFTTTGANPLTSLDPVGGGSVIPDKYVTRAVFDPTDKNTVYITLAGYMGGTTTALSHVWKVTSLNTVPVLTGINSSLPDVPVNAFAVDPSNSSNLFAGTDIGVYASNDGGASWQPLGTALPRVAVFDMAFRASNRTLRIATHGRGMWQLSVGANPNFNYLYLPIILR